MEVKASPRVKAVSSLNHSLHSAYSLPPWSLRMEYFRRVSPASQSTLCPAGLQPCQLGCGSGKIEDELSLRGAVGPLSLSLRSRLLWTWGGRGHPMTLLVSPAAAARGGDGDRV